MMAAKGPVQREPKLWERISIWISNLIPFDSCLPLAAITVLLRRNVLQKINLLAAPDAPPAAPADPVLPYRTADGSGTDPRNVSAGASGTPFGRNMTPHQSPNPLRVPPVQLIAQKLLARRKFRPAGDQLNVLAAAWIQFMTHDWMRGLQSDETTELSQGTGCPLMSFKFRKTAVSEAGTVINTRTHWWDTSVLYGQDAESAARVRTFQDGLLAVGPARGALPMNSDGTTRIGDNQNSWAGVQLLQELFLREHNAIATSIALQHPELRGNDEKLFNLSRLVVAAVAAKIHTIDWTVRLLDTKSVKVGMKGNWFGLWRAIGVCKKGPPAPFSLVGKTAKNHGVPFSLTEEFVAVYRLHPMLPDGLPLRSGDVELSKLIGREGESALANDGKPLEVWDAMIEYPCGNLELFNYPKALRALSPTTEDGTPVHERVDLAALDLYRDRERGIRNFNGFRRALHLKPFRSYHDLTGGDKEAIEALEEVYGPDGLEDVDLLVGNLAEKKIKGFAISETSFVIFLLMASRRLEADRFLNEDFNEETYTRTGFNWIKRVSGLRDVLERHWPETGRHFKDMNSSAFKPTTAWPERFLEDQE